MSDKQSVKMLNDIQKRLIDLSERLEKIEKRQLKKKWLSFDACIPPIALCKDIVATYNSDKIKSFDYTMKILSDYYDTQLMDNRNAPERVPEKAIACYYSSENTAYYKQKTSSLETVLHEFFHHLVANNIVFLNGKNEQKCADRFAEIIMFRGNSL